MITSAFAPSLGIQPDPKIVWARAAVAFNAYECGQFDLAWADAGTISDILGQEGSSMTRVIKPTAGGIVCGILGLWLGSVSAGARGRLMLWGEATAKLIKASGNIARADRLIANTSGYLTPDHAAGDRIIALSRDALTGPSAATEATVLFNGVHGLGVYVS